MSKAKGKAKAKARAKRVRKKPSGPASATERVPQMMVHSQGREHIRMPSQNVTPTMRKVRRKV